MFVFVFVLVAVPVPNHIKGLEQSSFFRVWSIGNISARGRHFEATHFTYQKHIFIDEAIVSLQYLPFWSDEATQFPYKKHITIDAAIVPLQNLPL